LAFLPLLLALLLALLPLVLPLLLAFLLALLPALRSLLLLTLVVAHAIVLLLGAVDCCTFAWRLTVPGEESGLTPPKRLSGSAGVSGRDSWPSIHRAAE
jgi:hypothetical protein